MLAADTDVAKRPLEETTERPTKRLVGKTSLGTKRGPAEPVEELEQPQDDLGDARMTLLETLAVEAKVAEEEESKENFLSPQRFLGAPRPSASFSSRKSFGVVLDREEEEEEDVQPWAGI